jgi:putative endonuclease
MFTVYILQSESSGRFYVGHAENLDDRLLRHQQGRSASTRGRGPWHLMLTEVFPTRAQAMAREKEIKSWKSAVRIRGLIEESIPPGGTGG